jgi:hypothetical protein
MATDPESVWNYGPTVNFRYPEFSPAELLQNYCQTAFGRAVDENDLAWLSRLLAEFLNWSELDYVNPDQARQAAERLLEVLRAVDDIMTNSRQPLRDWQQISLALGLPSSYLKNLTEAKIAHEFGRSKMAISKSISKLLKLAELPRHPKGYNGSQISC